LCLAPALRARSLAPVFPAIVGATRGAAGRRGPLRGGGGGGRRERAARLAGELEAARRIQMGSLPDPAIAFPGETRLDLYAFLEPAREVGGDLYDFFPLDHDRLCFLIGDVSGKGLPGSLFMAVSKALYKSGGLRAAGPGAAGL